MTCIKNEASHEFQFNQCPNRASTRPLDRHFGVACAQVFKLFRGRVFDCRRYPGADASIAEVESNVYDHLRRGTELNRSPNRYRGDETELIRCRTTNYKELTK